MDELINESERGTDSSLTEVKSLQETCRVESGKERRNEEMMRQRKSENFWWRTWNPLFPSFFGRHTRSHSGSTEFTPQNLRSQVIMIWCDYPAVPAFLYSLERSFSSPVVTELCVSIWEVDFYSYHDFYHDLQNEGKEEGGEERGSSSSTSTFSLLFHLFPPSTIHQPYIHNHTHNYTTSHITHRHKRKRFYTLNERSIQTSSSFARRV